MPLINILFWMMLLLTAYMTLSLLSAYYKAEREAQRQLLRLQARQRVRDQKGSRPHAAANHAARLVQPPQSPPAIQVQARVFTSAVCDQSRSDSGARCDSGRTPDRVLPRSSTASRRAKVPFRTGGEQTFVYPVSQTCRFQQVAMTRERKDTANLSFDWTRPVQKSALTQQTGSGTTCDQDKQSRHNCA